MNNPGKYKIMNSGKNFYDKQINKETKKKQKSKEQNDNNNNINSEKIVIKKEENDLLNKKKKREKEEEIDEEKEINQNDKLEINQNMYNQYNFYQGIIPSIEWQLQQLRNQNINYQELYQNIYYIQNQYNVFPNNNEIQPYFVEGKEFINLKDNINNIYERGIVNNLIGAFFIEECKEAKNVDEKTINNKINNKKDKKEDKSSSLKDVKKYENNLENQNVVENNENESQEIYNEATYLFQAMNLPKSLRISD